MGDALWTRQSSEVPSEQGCSTVRQKHSVLFIVHQDERNRHAGAQPTPSDSPTAHVAMGARTKPRTSPHQLLLRQFLQLAGGATAENLRAPMERSPGLTSLPHTAASKTPDFLQTDLVKNYCSLRAIIIILLILAMSLIQKLTGSS